MPSSKKTFIPPEVQADFDTFWKEHVCDSKGRLNKRQVMLELYDYRQLMDNAARVYNHVTGGAISKPMTDADTVMSFADDTEGERWEEYLKEEKEAWGAGVVSGSDIFHVTLRFADVRDPIRKATVTLPVNVPIGQVHEVFYDTTKGKLVDSSTIPEGWVEDIEDAIKLLTEAK